MGSVLAAPRRAGHAVPGLGRRDLDRRQRAALRREPAPGGRAVRDQRRRARPGHGEAVARQGDVVQQLRRRRRGLARGARPRAGRASRSSSTPTRAASRSPLRLDIADAHRKAHACDPISAFGGVIAANRDGHRGDGRADRGDLHRGRRRARPTPTARWTCWRARRTCASWSPSRRARRARSSVPVSGGLLMQTRRHDRRRRATTRPSGRWPPATRSTRQTLADLAFAWRAVRAVKSNAILLAHDGASVGVGMGQVNRVDAARLAVSRAGDRAKGSVAASDAFFPFPDGLEVLLDGRCPRGRAAGRLGARRRGDRGGRSRRACRCT